MLTHLPHRVVIQSESRSLFIGGAYTTSWTTDSTVWANCQSYTDKESYNNDKTQEYNKYKVITRYLASITNKKRLLFDSKILHIETIKDPTNRGRMMEITCREEVI